VLSIVGFLLDTGFASRLVLIHYPSVVVLLGEEDHQA
jgi:hypothetical protein